MWLKPFNKNYWGVNSHDKTNRTEYMKLLYDAMGLNWFNLQRPSATSCSLSAALQWTNDRYDTATDW